MTNQTIDIPQRAPVMVLPSTHLFPNALLPLFIFEPRYRAMLKWALENDRMFCLAMRKPGIEETEHQDDFFHTGSLGLVRACVAGKDGTSHLMLQGLIRVKFTGFSQTKPFFIAEIDAQETEQAAESDTGPLMRELRKICKRFRGGAYTESIEAYLMKMESPELFADAVANAFIQDSLMKQAILEEHRLVPRLEMIISALSKEKPAK